MSKLWNNRLLKNTISKIEKKFPKVFKLYQITTKGIKVLFSESKVYLNVSKSIRNNEDLSKYPLHDLVVYKQIPKDWRQVAPVIVLTSFPFLQYVIIPIAYMYPIRLLSQQFWSNQHKLSFYEEKNQQRVSLRSSLITSLVETVDKDDSHDVKLKNLFIDTLDKYNSDKKILPEELLELKVLFEKKQFNLRSLKDSHLIDLATFHDCNSRFYNLRLSKLEFNSFIMRNIDKALPKDTSEISHDYILRLAHERGADVKEKSENDLVSYLKVWQDFSLNLFNAKSPEQRQQLYTLYLHASILLSKNYFPSIQIK